MASSDEQDNHGEDGAAPADNKRARGLSVGLALGTSIGLVLGMTVFDNLGLGLALGMGLGIAVGAAIGVGGMQSGDRQDGAP
ncbi:hypothetical protein [Streptomyces sp. AC550_RSS872]|uniref:hypothetical protein n=1 Tax=Streptomyces sp. AC550_RSS872 TaxID=2823689 RepID=UPI001C26FEC6|nr:hypothetical protein [Streptomyces sp. AC550_RSS872]